MMWGEFVTGDKSITQREKARATLKKAGTRQIDRREITDRKGQDGEEQICNHTEGIISLSKGAHSASRHLKTQFGIEAILSRFCTELHVGSL